MMGMLGHALAQGVAGAAASGADSIERGIKHQQQIAAEQRAASLQLDLQQRLAAAKELQQQRVDERFQAILKRKQSEGVALEIAPGDPAPTDPAAMTGTRTRSEAVQAALEEASLTDGAAYRAGRGMLDAEIEGERKDRSENRAEKRDDSRYEFERDRLESQDRRAEAGRKSREGIAGQRIAASVSKGGAGGKTSARVQELEYLRKNLGMSDAEVKAYVTQSKGMSLDQIVMRLKKEDKFKDLSQEELFEQAREIKRQSTPDANASAPASSAKSQAVIKYDMKTGKVIY